ncbi:MAG: zinc-binding dehydrogenase [Pseudomonadota bacterium]
MTAGTHMGGVVLTGHGGAKCLEWRDDLTIPKPAAGEVLIRVGAAAVNNTDINTRRAWYSKAGSAASDASWSGSPIAFPRVQGIDACGTITSVGAGVDPARVGQRVLVEPCLREASGVLLDRPWFLGSECDGGFADYLTVAARHAHTIDSALSDTELASFPCSYSTAENMLTRSGVLTDDRVLITGASGGVGSAAVQLVRARGAVPVAVSTAAKAERLVEIGAETVLGRDDTYGENGFDVAIDLVGGAGFSRLIDAVRPGGRIATAGAVAGAGATVDLRTIYLKDISIFGCTVLDDGVFAGLVEHIEAGRITPLVAEVYPLRALAAAQEAFFARGHVGKIAIAVADA